MNRTVTRRLERLEANAKASTASANREPHVLCFVNMDRRVVSTFEMATGKWTHFDPPRERAEFDPMV
jgi:hypothetical protein